MVVAARIAVASRCAVLLIVAGCSVQESRVDPPARLVDRGAVLASQCSGCHAAGASDAAAIRSLDGYTAPQIEALLTTYRDARPGETSMHRMARGYTDEDIRLLSRHLSRRASVVERTR